MNKEFIADLITELSYRLVDGLPDLKNDNHLIILRQVMEEKGLSYDLIEKTMNNLRVPVKKNPNSTSPTKFSVDFDGVHSDQAESEPYINPIQPQDHADQDELPMDDRDPEERDTPADESVNELDYMDVDTEDEDEITERDIVQKKTSGNVYDVDAFDPKLGQRLVKKDASPEEIEKASKSKPSKKEEPKKDVKKKPEKETVFAQKSEISKGLFSDEYENVNGVDVRNMVDSDGNVVDVSTPEGRKQGAEILGKRIKDFGGKIIKATTILASDKAVKQFKSETGETKTLIQKWLGEVGELQNMKDFLSLGKRAYLLTDSAPKNDLVVFTDSGKDKEINMAYVSVKTVKGGKQENGLGANCKSEYKTYISKAEKQDVNISIGGKEYSVDANTYVSSTIDVKSDFFRTISEANGVCAGKEIKGVSEGGGCRYNPEDKSKFLPGAEKHLYKYTDAAGNEITAFKSDSDFLRNRTLSKEEVEEIFNAPRMDKMYGKLDGSKSSETDNKVIRAKFKQEILERIEKSGGKFSLFDLQHWETDNIGNTFSEINAPIYSTSDTGVAFFTAGSPDLTTEVVPAESVNEVYKEKRKKINAIKDPKERADALVGLTGLSQRVRKLGGSPKKKKCQAYLDGIDNTKPIVKSKDHRIPVAEYSEKYLDNK